MQSIYMGKHFYTIYKQREKMFAEISALKNEEQKRPEENKWSLLETYYHLYLMVRRFRQLNKIYIPLSKPIAHIRKNKPYQTYSKDIYTEYTRNHNKGMRAPAILLPPGDINNRISFTELIEKLDNETKRFENMISAITDNIAGHIRYPDPIANNPTLIQSIDLLGIHEEHHFRLCRKYYNLV